MLHNQFPSKELFSKLQFKFSKILSLNQLTLNNKLLNSHRPHSIQLLSNNKFSKPPLEDMLHKLKCNKSNSAASSNQSPDPQWAREALWPLQSK